MVRVEEIIYSKEMSDVVRAIEALRAKFSSEEYFEPVEFGAVELAYAENYRSDIVLRILIDDKLYYPGYKKVLAASFAGWLTLPDDDGYRPILVIKAALDHMKSAAKKADKGMVLTVEQDVVARYILTGSEFLVNVYDQIGGYDAFQSAPSVHDTWARDSQVKAAKSVARAICFLHHGIICAQEQGRQFSPSLNKAVVAFDALRERKDFHYEKNFVGRSLLHRRWSAHKETLALLYAASTINVRQRNLLDIVLSGEFSYQSHRKYLQGWVGRARYVAAFIFARMVDATLVSRTSAVLGHGKMTPFSPGKLDEIEKDVALEQMKKYFR